MINFVQYGIDTHNSTRLGLGDRETAKWPILFAGIMLGEASMQSSSYGGFREITSTYYGTGWGGATGCAGSVGSTTSSTFSSFSLNVTALTICGFQP